MIFKFLFFKNILFKKGWKEVWDITNQFSKEISEEFQILEDEDMVLVYWLKPQAEKQEKQLIVAFMAKNNDKAEIEAAVEKFRERQQL